MRFADTNILLYAISSDPREAGKADRAVALLARRDIGLSVQVLQEFYVQATRRNSPNALRQEAIRRRRCPRGGGGDCLMRKTR